jgi:hypothetical protein
VLDGGRREEHEELWVFVFEVALDGIRMKEAPLTGTHHR